MKSSVLKTKQIINISLGRPFFLMCMLFAACMPIPSSDAGQFDIVINEIMYHPSNENLCGEFLEIYNRGVDVVNVGGWQLQDEQQIIYTLPANTMLNGGEYLVFYNDANAVECYGLVPSKSFGPYAGKLDNGGEHIQLKNASWTVIDEVNYDDNAPWPVEADGEGPSLELISPDEDNNNATSWGLGQFFSPGMANNPLAPGGGDVVITEIMYKPLKKRYVYTLNPFWSSNPYQWNEGDDPTGEYIELFNRGAEPIDLNGWKLTDEEGLLFAFDSSMVLNPGSYMTVCSDAAAISERYGISHVVGDFLTAGDRLANGGERITVLNAHDQVIDSVRYNDTSPWPLAPDQIGSALECMDPFGDNSEAENWRTYRLEEEAEPQATHEWQYVEVTGNATSQTLYFYINGIGEWLVDQITIRPAGGGANVLTNGSFDPDDAGWLKSGNHASTYRTTADYYDGSGSEHMVSTGVGGSSANSLYRTSITGMTVNQSYTISCRLKYLIGHETLTFRLSGSSTSTGIFKTVTAAGLEGIYPPNPAVGNEIFLNRGTPGQVNSVWSAGLPPFIDVEEIQHTPRKPTSSDPVIITAKVTPTDYPATNVSLHYEVFTKPYQIVVQTQDIAMLDDGLSGDGSANDGIYGATIPVKASQTLVRYRITVTDTAAQSWSYPDECEPNPNRAYFVYDNGDIDSQAQTYFLIAPQENLDFLLDNIWSHEYVDCAVVIEGIVYDHVGIHLRGQGWRHQPKKGWKLSFNKGEYFRDMNKLDLAMHRPVEQKVAHDLFWSLGHGNLACEVVRFHINGAFYGLFLAEESLNSATLKRRGLDDSGEVFHPDAYPYNDLNYYTDPASYPQVYEKKSDPFGSFQSLMDISNLITNTPSNQILNAMLEEVELDEWFYRWALNNCGPNFDISRNNFILIHPAEPDKKWQWISYDYSHYYGDVGGASLDPYYSPNKWMERCVSSSSLYSSEFENRNLVILNDIVQNYHIVEKLFTIMDETYAKYQTDINEELALGYGDWGPFVRDYNQKESIKSLFASRNAWLKTWLAGKTFTLPANRNPLIQMDVPIINNNTIDITWDYSDAEGDACTVDLYWSDLAWEYMIPIPGGQNLPAENRHFVWTSALPEDYLNRKIYVQAAIRDGNSYLVHHDTSRPAMAVDSCADIWEIGRGMTGDINRDCHVDTADLTEIAASWLLWGETGWDFQQDYNPAQLGSPGQNPYRNWTYGAGSELNDFSAFNKLTQDTTANSWTLSSASVSGFPILWKNFGTWAYGVNTNEVSVHPAPPGSVPDLAKVRWTSPVSETVHITGKFAAGHDGAVDVWIIKNGNAAQPLFSQLSASADIFFDVTVSVSIGTTLDFVVGPSGDYGADNTPLYVLISQGVLNCGDPAATAADLNQDCRIDLQDTAILVGDWLNCNDPQDGSCLGSP